MIVATKRMFIFFREEQFKLLKEVILVMRFKLIICFEEFGFTVKLKIF